MRECACPQFKLRWEVTMLIILLIIIVVLLASGGGYRYNRRGRRS